MPGPLPPLINRSYTLAGNWSGSWRYGVPGYGTWASRSGSSLSFLYVEYKEPPKRTLLRADFTRPPTSYDRRSLVSTGLVGKCYYETKRGAVGSDRYQNRIEGRVSAALSMAQVLPEGEVFSLALHDQALHKMYSNLSKTKVQLGTMLMEMKKTVSMLETASLRILRGLRGFADIRRRYGHGGIRYAFRNADDWKQFLADKPGALWRGSQEIPDLWLEMQFGWRPWFSEIEGFAHALAEMITAGVEPDISVRGKATQWSDRVAMVNIEGLPSARVKVTVPRQERCLFATRWVLDAGQTDARFLNILGLNNPMGDIWEVARYSCLVDYLLPIGNTVTSVAAAQGLTYKEGSITRARVIGDGKGLKQPLDLQGRITVDNESDAEVTLFSGSDLHSYIHGIRMQRITLGFPPIPPLRLPDIQNKLNAKRLANVLSVITAVLRGREISSRT